MGRTACTEPQCLYKGALYLYLTVELYLYSPLWAVRPVLSLSACTRVHFTFTLPTSFSLLVYSLLSSVICYGITCLYGAPSFFCSPVFCPKLGLYLIPLPSLCLFCNWSVYRACISSLLLLFFFISCINGPIFTTV